MIDPINHSDLAISRLAVQFKESENLIGYIRALVAEGDELETVFQQLLNERSISTAVGVQLDILGELVGQSRSVIDGAFVKYFGFANNPNGDGFNTEPYWDGQAPLITTGFLTDDQYRNYIRAKAFTNHATGVHEDFVAVFKLLFGEDTKVMTENLGNANARIYIGHDFTAEDELLIRSSKKNKILPRAAGVGVEYVKFPAGGPFGFSANPLAGGFNTGGFFSLIGVV